MRDSREIELGDQVAGWAVFNRGTLQARIERIDEEAKFPGDVEATRYCVENVGTDPKCLLAVCETFATDELVRAAVEDNLMRGSK